MKIAYIDTSVDGHHLAYLSALIGSNKGESVLIVPERVDAVACKQYEYKTAEGKKRTPKVYLQWLREVHALVEKEKPDIVHFLYGDLFYRFFGLGLSLFRKYRTVVTFHWAKDGLLGRISTNLICRQIDDAVVHSAYLQKSFNHCGAHNVTHIEYPQFNAVSVDKKEACAFWGISPDIPTIACVGHTRPDKGLDILLEALLQVNTPFQLLVAGKEDAFDRAFIEEKAKTYLDRVHLCLRYLSDEEVGYAFGACDIVALPYRRVFNGASGPLGEGVWLGKCIIGSDHGNLGDTISRNHLGYTFESENPDDLASVLNTALSKPFVLDDLYQDYKLSLRTENFIRSYLKLYQKT